MNSDQAIGLARNLLAAIGGIVLAHGFVNGTTWEAASGFVLAAIAAVFAWQAHALTLDAVLGVVRSGVAALGGYVTFKGYATQDAVNQWASVILALVPLGWSYSAHAPISLPPATPFVSSGLPPRVDSPLWIGLTALALGGAIMLGGCDLSSIDASVRKYAPIVGKDILLIGDIVVQAECSPGLAPASGTVANVLNIVAPNSPAANKVQKVLATNVAVAGQLCPLVASIKTTVGAVPAGTPSQAIPATGA